MTHTVRPKPKQGKIPGEGRGEVASSSNAAYVVGNDTRLVLIFALFCCLFLVLFLGLPSPAPPWQNTSRSSRAKRCTTVPSSRSSRAKTADTRTETSRTLALLQGRDEVGAAAGSRPANMIPAARGTTTCCLLLSLPSQSRTEISSASDVRPQPRLAANLLSFAMSLARAGSPGTTDLSKWSRASKPSDGSVQHV